MSHDQKVNSSHYMDNMGSPSQNNHKAMGGHYTQMMDVPASGSQRQSITKANNRRSNRQSGKNVKMPADGSSNNCCNGCTIF